MTGKGWDKDHAPLIRTLGTYSTLGWNVNMITQYSKYPEVNKS